jgi:hypothetical protein
MNQEHNTQATIQAEALEAQNLPELRNAFETIEKFKNNDEQLILDENGFPVQEEGEKDEELPEDENEEEENEELPEDENEEEEEYIPPKPIKEKKVDKYRKLQNDKYRALAEKEEALQKIAELEGLVQEFSSSGTYHYSKNIYADLDRAKEDKKRAFEEGNLDNLVEADISIAKAIQAISDLEKWANENESRQLTNSKYQENERSSYQESVYQEIAKDWIDTHPYLKPHSRSYNPKLASKVTQFITELDDNLYRNREEAAIFSEEYFDTIDNYIYSKTGPKRDTSKKIESLSNVSGVRNTASAGGSKSSSTNQMTLTKEEKIMADNAGLSHKDWLKEKIYYSKHDRERGGQYGR